MISNNELRVLAGHREEGPHVSLFMPTARVGAEIQQGPIRFKNLISEVESQLKQQGMRKPEIEALLKPVQERLEDDDFWQHQSNNEDLLDLAAVQTYLNGGTVYVVKPGEVPGGGLSAVVLRY